MDFSNIVIEGFSPNCLMGVIGAVAKYKYNESNINRLFFHHSYVYEKKEEVKYLEETEGLNVWFSRELPIKKEEFSKRLMDYYGLCHYTAAYSEFDDMLEVIQCLNNANEPVMVEIDFFYMKKHRYYQKVHDQHMMIIYNIDFENRYFEVCEAVFGYIRIGFEEYYEYFKEVKFNRNRDIFIMILKRAEKDKNNTSYIENFIKDIDKSLNNLTIKNTQTLGLEAFNNFSEDFIHLIKSDKCSNNFFVPGMWVFMCDCLNNAKFITEFKNVCTDFYSKELDEIKKCFNKSNRKWFTITTALNQVYKQNADDFVKVFHELMELDKIIVDRLQTLNTQLVDYSHRKKENI